VSAEETKDLYEVKKRTELFVEAKDEEGEKKKKKLSKLKRSSSFYCYWTLHFSSCLHLMELVYYRVRRI